MEKFAKEIDSREKILADLTNPGQIGKAYYPAPSNLNEILEAK